MNDTKTKTALPMVGGVDGRKCGSCSECCTVLEVHAVIRKPGYTRCEHAKRGSATNCCKIYNTRPEPCALFTCGWLHGIGDKRDRPDKLGVLFTTEHHDDLGGRVLFVWETRRDARKSQRVRYVLKLVQEQNPDLPILGAYRDAAGVEQRCAVYLTPTALLNLQKLNLPTDGSPWRFVDEGKGKLPMCRACGVETEQPIADSWRAHPDGTWRCPACADTEPTQVVP